MSYYANARIYSSTVSRKEIATVVKEKQNGYFERFLEDSVSPNEEWRDIRDDMESFAKLVGGELIFEFNDEHDNHQLIKYQDGVYMGFGFVQVTYVYPTEFIS